jgi:alpha-L-fucosidase
MLNISQKSDSTIPEGQKEVLLGIGKWFNIHGEAIYGTWPWYTYGEGPTKEPEGHFSQHKEFLKIVYTSDDVRYTTKGEFIYATIRGWPDEKREILLTAFRDQDLAIESVSLIGCQERIEWSLDENGLHINFPDERVNEMANVFKIKIVNL